LENALGNLEGDSLVLISRGELAEEHAINSNPARFYEKSMTQSLQRQMNRELRKAFEPKRVRVSTPEEDGVSEELDKPAVQRQPTGRFKDVVGLSGTHEYLVDNMVSEINAAVKRLLPSSDDVIAQTVKEDYQRYLDRKYCEAGEDEDQ
jgi:hypothetical protein